MKNENEMKRG